MLNVFTAEKEQSALNFWPSANSDEANNNLQVIAKEDGGSTGRILHAQLLNNIMLS